MFNDYDILLDTTAANWKLTWMINGAVVGNPYTFTANPSIGNVIFGTNKLTGAVSGFQLTASEMSEPASLGLLGLGVAGLVACRRR